MSLSNLSQPNDLQTDFMVDNDIDFKKIINQLYRHLWTILGIAASTGFFAFLYTFTMHPVYQTTAILQVHSNTSKAGNVLGTLGYKSTSDSEVNTQEALIKTRYILEPAVIQNGLNIATYVRYFPIIGHKLAQHYKGNGLAKPFLGLKSYAWGGEKIEVKQFSVPSERIGKDFRVVADKDNLYRLYDDQGNLILTGKVGELAISTLDKNIKLEISTLNARPETPFHIAYLSPVGASMSLGRRISISDIQGNDPLQTTGIFQIALVDSDPVQAVQILNNIISFTVSKNAQQTDQETQETLNFLEEKLPELKNSLATSENNLNVYHAKYNTLSMQMISQLLVQRLISLEQGVSKLKSQREDLLQLYTPKHPLVIAHLNKEAELQKQLEAAKSEIRQFPFISQEEIDLQREAKIKNLMYTNLLNHEQQIELAKAGLHSDITIISDATPASQLPVYKSLTIIVGFLLGGFLSSLVIALKNLWTKTVEDAEQLENEIHLPVHAVIPFSRKQKQMEKTYQKTLNTLGSGISTKPLVLAKQEPNDLSIESLRSLNVAIQMMMSSATHPVIAIMGSMGNVGKSFVAMNLAQIIANTGKRTLLIDADIRKGHLHQTFLQPKAHGLSEYLQNECDIPSIIRNVDHHLSFIACGISNKHPIELLKSPLLKALLSQVKEHFDQVIIDTPPILPVIDSMLITKFCDTKLFVVNAGKDSMADVKQAIKKARLHEVEINGFILNHRKPITPYGINAYTRYSYGEIPQSSTV